MIARWLAQMNQRERILALSVGGILFLLINLAIWSALFGMSAGARADYATQRATRTEQTVYLGEEKMWKKRAEWLKKKQSRLNNPAEASTLLTQVKQIAGKYNVQIDNPQIGAVETTSSHQAVSATFETKSDWGAARAFSLRRPEAGSVHRFRAGQLDRRRERSDSDAGPFQNREVVCPGEEMMKAREFILVSTGLFLCLTTAAWAKDDLPTTEEFAHYQPMLQRSPFAVATAGALPNTPDFAKDLYVANAAHSTEGDFVTLASTTDKNRKEYLSTKETVHGYSISNIQWSDQVGETKVTITKDGQFATLTFNEALLSQAIQNPVGQIPQTPQQGIPGRPTSNPQMPNSQMPIQRPMPVPQIPTPPPHVRPVIRRGATPQQPVRQAPAQPIPDDDSDLDES